MQTDKRSRSIPATIGRFRIERLLGSGGMGEVYKAFDPTLRRTVALKTVKPELDHPEMIDRLYREALACAQLQHSNIVTVYDAGESDGGVFIAMEFLKGEDLGAVLGRRTLTTTAKLEVLLQILAALEHAHRQGVVHRDIKPSNVFRLVDGSIKLVDFGIARVAAADTLTLTGSLVATLHYASPEQLRGERVDQRADLYAVGVLAYLMFAGRRPFEGDTPGTLIAKAITEAPAAMDVWLTRRLPEIERIVNKAVAKSLADRYQTAEEMRSDLVTFIAESAEAIAAADREAAEAAAASAEQARTLIASGNTPGAVAMLAETLRINPDAADAGKLLEETLRKETSDPPSTLIAPVQGTVKNGDVAGKRRNVVWWGGAAAAAILLVVAVTVWSGFASERDTPRVEPVQEKTVGANEAEKTGTEKPAPEKPAPEKPATEKAATEKPAAQTPTAPKALSNGGNLVTTPARPAPKIPETPIGGEKPANAVKDDGVKPAAPVVPDAQKLFYRAAPASTGETPVVVAVNTGLRVRLLQRADGDAERAVDMRTTFRSGDAVRFEFTSNTEGHLYVVAQGSSGAWKTIFPQPQINGGLNRIKPFEAYRVPDQQWFEFVDPPGSERVFVFLSKEPVSELPGLNRVVASAADVDNAVVNRLQNSILSRDLVLQGGADVKKLTPATFVVNLQELGKSVALTIDLIHR
ncbi:MAG TPA: protein kinase [Vicinamibacterales bacterium]|nr:protein kinase [Vicinamibacterales bacterium]